MSYGSYFLSEYGSVGNVLYAYLCDIVSLCISQKKGINYPINNRIISTLLYIRTYESSSRVPVNVNRQVGICIQE